MRVIVCDICLAKDEKLTPATVEYKRRFKWGNVKIYLCKEHKNYIEENELDKFPKGEEEKEMEALIKIQDDADKSYHKMFNKEKGD